MQDDLISRQAAIDAVGDVHPLDYNAVAIVERLKNLPSAQSPVFETKLDGTESDVEILSKLRCQFNCFNGDERPWYEALSRAIKVLRSEPGRKKGKWLEPKREQLMYFGGNVGSGEVICSVCGGTDADIGAPYCWHCGADMRGCDNEHVE